MRYEQLSDRVKAALAQADAAVAGVVPFIANLYDPESGGFYFALSGKNDPDLAPGLEMTAWGIMITKGQTDAWDDMPTEVREKFIQFFHDRQDPVTGYYIDKQGPANDRETARIQNATLNTLRLFPEEPKYPHPINVKKPTSEQTANVPAYMETVESYLDWVSSLPWAKESWAAGDKVQASQIFVKTLPEDKQVQYVEALMNWLDTHQDPETGLWAEEIDFNSISGAFKNGLTYGLWDRQLLRIDEIINSIVRCYQTHQADKPFYVRNPLSLLRQIADYSEEFRKKVQDTVLEHIELMMDNFSRNKCPDGGYSSDYQKTNLSFGGVVGSHGLFEGDSNATLMILLARRELYNIFEVDVPPLKADHFWDWITGKEEMPSPYQNSL